jgi:2'-hydroxyisoflavone reductase
MSTSRRDVLKLAAAGAAGLALPVPGAAQPAPPARVSTEPPPSPAVERAARPLRLLILGGTGFTGPHQVRYALARGHKLTLFNRGRRPKEWPGEVEELVGDRNLGQLDPLKGREWDACIDNPTSLPAWVRDAGQVLKGKVGQYVFISTQSVYASEKEAGADETAALAEYKGADAMKETMETLRADVEGLYGALKVRCEREAETWFPGITTVIRPTLIVGPLDESDRFTYWPVRLDRGGDVLAPGDGGDPVQFIDARDLAEWTVRMVEARTFGAFNAGGPAGTMTMEEMLHGVRAATSATPVLRWVPADFLAAQKVQPWSDMPVWVPSNSDMMGFSRRNNGKAVTAGLTYRPLARTALDTLAWFTTLPAERQAKLRAGIDPAREREVLAAWKSRRAPGA